MDWQARSVLGMEACGLPALQRSSLRSVASTSTMLSLALVSHSFNAFITPRLYAKVRLTTPSALRSFQEALASRPALGGLVVLEV